MNNELISIIVPVYKVEKYLERCVKSIQEQTYTNLEIILVDDGSPDRCGQLCDEFAKLDERIKVYHKENGGISDARNYGIDKATGEYIGFVDSDDYIHESMYEKLYEAIKKSGTMISECGLTRVYKNTLRPHYEGKDYFLVLDKQEYLKEFLENRKVYGSVWCKLIHRDIVKKIKFSVGMIYEDALYNLELIKNVDKFTLISDSYYYYYIREDSYTTKPFNNRSMDYIDVIEKISEYTLVNFPEFKEQLLTRVAFAYVSIFNQLIEVGNYKNKKEYKILKNKLKSIHLEIISSKNVPKNLKIAFLLLSINEKLYKFVLSKYKKYERND